MKRLVSAAIAVSLLAAPALASDGALMKMQKQRDAARAVSKVTLPQISVPFLNIFGSMFPSAVNTAAPTTPTDPIAALQTFTVSDLQAALADAQGQTPPDTTAATCYAALIPIVSSNVQNPLPTTKGAFILFQKGRDLIANANAIKSDLTGGALNTACAPLVLSAENTIIMLAAQVGVKVALPVIP